MQTAAPETTREHVELLHTAHDNIFLDEPFLLVIACFIFPLLLVILSPKFGKTLTVFGAVIAVTGMSYALYIHHAPGKEEQYAALADSVVQDINAQYHIQEATFEVTDDTAEDFLHEDESLTLDIQVLGEDHTYRLGLNDDGKAYLIEPVSDGAPSIENIAI